MNNNVSDTLLLATFCKARNVRTTIDLIIDNTSLSEKFTVRFSLLTNLSSCNLRLKLDLDISRALQINLRLNFSHFAKLSPRLVFFRERH